MEGNILRIYVLISSKIGPPLRNSRGGHWPPLEKIKGGHWPPLEKFKGGHWPPLEMKGVYHPGQQHHMKLLYLPQEIELPII